MTKPLQSLAAKPISARSKRSHQGWSPERRARQAALIRRWAPWRRATGPKTDAGKARCATNALKHGYRSQARIRQMQRVRYVLRLAADNIKRVRLLIRMRNSRPRIKYKFPPPRAVCSSESHAILLARFERFSSPLTGGEGRSAAASCCGPEPAHRTGGATPAK